MSDEVLRRDTRVGGPRHVRNAPLSRIVVLIPAGTFEVCHPNVSAKPNPTRGVRDALESLGHCIADLPDARANLDRDAKRGVIATSEIGSVGGDSQVELALEPDVLVYPGTL